MPPLLKTNDDRNVNAASELSQSIVGRRENGKFIAMNSLRPLQAG